MKLTNLYKNGLPAVEPVKLWTTQSIIQERNVLDVLNSKFECDSEGYPTERGWKGLSKILSIYSDNRFETSRYFLIKNGIINEQISISSQIPTFTNITPNNYFLDKLSIYAQKTDSKVLFAHNHPSGYVIPSEEDKNLTYRLEQIFIDGTQKPRFLGHAIIGHNGNTGIYNDKDRIWRVVSQNSIIPCESFNFIPQKSNLPVVMGDLGILSLASFAEKINNNVDWKTDDWIPGFYITKNKQVNGIQYFNSEDFWTAKSQNIPNILKNSATFTGSESVIFVMPKYDYHLFRQLEYFAQQTNRVYDVFHPTDTGYKTLKPFDQGGTIFHYNEKVNLVLMDSRVIKQKIREKEQDISKEIIQTIKPNLRGYYDEKYL